MSELLISQDGETATTLPETAEEKAKQLPEPSTYHVLCVLPEVDEEYDSGLVKAGSTVYYEEVLSPVLFVVKLGPDAYKDKIGELIEGYHFRDALFQVIELSRKGNQYMQKKEPWIVAKQLAENPDAQKLIDL